MLKYILLTLTFLISGNLISQESTTVFVHTNYMDWFHKEVSQFNSSLKNLESSNNFEAHSQYSKIEHALERFDTNINTIYEQMAKHMDKERIKILKQDYVDGKGIKYYLEIERMRKSVDYTEFQMTPEKMNDFQNSIAEVSEIKNRIRSSEKKDKTATIASLKQVCNLIETTESLLAQSSIN